MKFNTRPHRQAILLGILTTFLLSSPCLHAKSTSLSHQHPQIRAAFWGIAPIKQGEEQLQTLKAHGFTTALVYDGNYHQQPQIWEEWGKIAKKYEIRLFPVLNFAGPNEIETAKKTFEPYVDRYGNTLQATPCPLDARYWKHSIADRFMRLAFLLRNSPIPGLIFDTEMYGSEIAIYSHNCFCDLCWNEFFQRGTAFLSEQPHVKYKIAPDQRFAFLMHYGLLEQYTAFQIYELQTLLSRIEQEIHRIHPELLLGIVAYKDTWFYESLIRGLGTPERPIFVFSETSYVRGYTHAVDQEKIVIEENTREQKNTYSLQIARYIPGLWLGRFFPEDLPAQLYHLATHTNGYWIFTAGSLWNDEPLSEPYALHGSVDEYWKALKKANDALQHDEDTDETAVQHTPSLYPSSFYESSSNRLITANSLKEVIHELPSDNNHLLLPPDPTEHLYQGEILFHCRSDDPNGTLQINRGSENSYGIIRYKLFDQEGELSQSGASSHDAPSLTLPIPSPMTEMVSILIDAGSTPINVAFSGLSCLLEASGTFPLDLVTRTASYEFYVPSETSRIKIKAYTPEERSVRLAVRTPDGSVCIEHEIERFAEFAIDPSRCMENLTTQSDRDLWMISMNAVKSPLSFIRVYFYDERYPYLFPIIRCKEHEGDL